MAYLPGEILFAYAQEIQEKSRLVAARRRPLLSDYDEGSIFAPTRQHTIKEPEFYDAKFDRDWDIPGIGQNSVEWDW